MWLFQRGSDCSTLPETFHRQLQKDISLCVCMCVSLSQRPGFNQPGASLFLKNFPAVGLSAQPKLSTTVWEESQLQARAQWGRKLGEMKPAFNFAPCLYFPLLPISHVPLRTPVCGYSQWSVVILSPTIRWSVPIMPKCLHIHRYLNRPVCLFFLLH